MATASKNRLDDKKRTKGDAEQQKIYDPEVENALVGGLLLNPVAPAAVKPMLKPVDLFSGPARAAFTACMDLYDNAMAVNMTTVRSRLEQTGEWEQLGDMPLMRFIDACGDNTLPAIESYARIVQDYASSRRLVNAGGQIATAAYELTAAEARAKATLIFLEATQLAAGVGPRSISEMVDEWQANTDPLVGLQTGIRDLDDLTGGLHDEEIWVVASRPGVGKSAFVTQIMLHIAHKETPVGLFSLEMSEKQVLMRILSNQAQLNIQTVYRNQLEEEERALLNDVANRVKKLPIHIDDSGVLTVEELRSRALMLKHMHGVRVVFVDYLQLLRAEERMGGRNEDVAHISRTLMQLAKELGGPVVAVSQLNRRRADSKDSRPEMTNLRESGQIEQDAHVICFLHAEEDDPDYQNRIELIVAKQRNGPTGARDIYFDRTCGRFGDIDTRHSQL